MSSDIGSQLLPDRLPAPKKWHCLVTSLGALIVLAVVGMHAVPTEISGQIAHAVIKQTFSFVHSEAKSAISHEVPFVQLPHARASVKVENYPRTAWVVGYPRCGSTSTVVFVHEVSAADFGEDFYIETCGFQDGWVAPDPWDWIDETRPGAWQNPEEIGALFNQDLVNPRFHNCSEEMQSLLHCDFSNLPYSGLWGEKWNDSVTHVENCCEGPYSPARASRRCSEAASRTFKTTWYTDPPTDVIPVLEKAPQVNVVSIVRDPRGLYQSEKEMGYMEFDSLFFKHLGFAGPSRYENEAYWKVNQETRYPNQVKWLCEHWLVNTTEKLGNPSHLRRLCSSLVDMSKKKPGNPNHLRWLCSSLVDMTNVSHPRVFKVRFEDLISTLNTAIDMVSFLGYPWNREVFRIALKIFPGVSPGATWAKINHFPAPDASPPWYSFEIDVLHSTVCQLALKSWGYPEAKEPTPILPPVPVPIQ